MRSLTNILTLIIYVERQEYILKDLNCLVNHFDIEIKHIDITLRDLFTFQNCQNVHNRRQKMFARTPIPYKIYSDTSGS